MQGNNWGLLILLVVAVVIYALVQARKKPEDDDEDGEGTETPEDGSAPDGQAAPGGESSEPECSEVSWTKCQEQLSEAPLLSECDEVEFEGLDKAGAASGNEPEEEAGRETEVEPVLPSNHALNSAIRVQAWRLFRENYRKILPLSGIVVLWMTLKYLIQKAGLLPDWLTGVAGPLNLLVAPVVTLGATFAAVRLWDGEAPRPGMLFHFLKGRRYFPALGLMLLKGLLQSLLVLLLGGLFLLIRQIIFSGSSSALSDDAIRVFIFLSRAETLFTLSAIVWLATWLQMASFSYVRTPERGVMAAFRAGFRVGNRHFGSVLGMVIAAGWPLGAVSLLGYFVSFWGPAMRSPLTSLASVVLSLLLMLFYGGYVLISMAGLAARLLPDEAAPAEREGTVAPDESTGGDAPGATDDLAEGVSSEAETTGQDAEKSSDS